MIRFALCLALVTLTAAAAEMKLGKPLTLKEPMSIAALNAKPESFVGKTIQVKGKVTEVCQMMGCWMALVDPDTQAMIRVKVQDGDIVFPKESVGKVALAEGKLIRLILSREQAIARARHEAEEQGRQFDPSTITSGTTIYQLQGSGASIQN